MINMLASIESTISNFFEKLTTAVGFAGYLGIVLGVEVLFILIYGIKSAFSYEARFKKAMNRANQWLFAKKKLTADNIKDFTRVLKKGPKRITYFWQQYILYREGGPAAYLSEENMIEKPLRTSSWKNNVKNLGICTGVWAMFALVLGAASQANSLWNFGSVLLALVFPALVLLLGGISAVIIKGFRTFNLEDVYQSYHIFARFLTNACDSLPPYIELDLLFTRKELSKASAQLREFYEANARKAKEAFEEAKRADELAAEYNFKDVGVDGALLLDRAMKESENYINQKTKTLSQIAQVEAQKDAMRRNYENIQMDLQRKIQAARENIRKLIEQQAATTSRIEVGLLRQQQDKEAKKLDELQRDYDKEETRYKADRDEHEKEVARLSKILTESLEVAEKGMAAEYQTFFEKVMKSAYAVAEKKVEKEFKDLTKKNQTNEEELINVQTQIKRLLDENETLRAKIAEYKPDFKKEKNKKGKYNAKGNFVHNDGAYHDENGLFHDVDGNVYNMNGEKVSKDYTDAEADHNEREALVNDQVNQFGSFIDSEGKPLMQEEATVEEKQERVEEPVQTIEQPAENKAEEFGVSAEDEFAQFLADPVVVPVTEETKEETPVAEEKSAPQVTSAEDEFAEFLADPVVAPTQEEIDNFFEEKKEEPAAEEKQMPAEENKADDDDLLWGDSETAFVGGEVPQEETPVTEEKPDDDETPDEAPVLKEEREVEEETAAPAKKRGRPRKVVEEKKEETPARKRGRPRKVVEEAPAAPAKKRGRPRKDQTPAAAAKTEEKKPVAKKTATKKATPAKKAPAAKTTAKPARKTSRPKPRKRVAPKVQEQPKVEEAPAKKRGRPKKVQQEVPVAPAKKRGRPRKDAIQEKDIDSVSKISQLINEEEEKLNKMKALLNNEIDQVMVEEKKDNSDKEREDLMKSFEQLKVQADNVKNGNNSEELASINKRLEDLIKEINLLNNKNN